MQVISSSARLSQKIAMLRKKGQKVGFVPTMGFLHAGHLSLVEKSASENDVTVVSIFVNPTQFAPHEDFDAYPRDLQKDLDLLKGKADIVFNPEIAEIYDSSVSDSDADLKIDLKQFTSCLCGISRPHHFPGVAQVVGRLLRIVKPDNIYFGQKDYQQTVVIRHLIKQFFPDVAMHVCPTVREEDGLAMSSRNSYLNAEERQQAVSLSAALNEIKALLAKGERSKNILVSRIIESISRRDLAKIDYVDIRDAEDLSEVAIIGKPVVCAVACYIGKTRLIDNIIFNPENVS